LLTANSHASKELARRGFRLLLFPLGVCAIIFALVNPANLEALLRIYVGVMGVYVVFRRAITNYIIRRQFDKRPDKDIEITFDATETGMNWNTKESTSSFGWNLIFKGRRYQNGFLIFQNQRIFHWIPNHSFISGLDIQTFSELLKSKLKDYKEEA
jgi:hypothetical protein